MSEISISQQIFLKFFGNLKEKYDLDENIISQIKKLYQENKLIDATELDNFVKWLEEYNAKDKESKSQIFQRYN